MKAVYIEQFGGPEVVKYGDLPDPSAGPGQIVVDAFAASVNGADWKVRANHYGKAAPFPLILGRDFSGVVSALGAGVTDLRVGDEVFGVLETGREGAYAEKIAIAAAIVAKKPAALSHVDAAALALTGLTALCSIEDSLKLKSGETILIQGGAGGVASFAIQLAKHHRRPCHHHRQRRQPVLPARPRRRSGHRLQHHRLHQGGEQLRCGVRYRGRRRGDTVIRGSQARRTCRLHRIRTTGAEAGAHRRHRLAAGRRPRPPASRSHCRALPGRRHPQAGGHALQFVRSGRSASVSEARHLRGKLVFMLR